MALAGQWQADEFPLEQMRGERARAFWQLDSEDEVAHLEIGSAELRQAGVGRLAVVGTALAVGCGHWIHRSGRLIEVLVGLLHPADDGFDTDHFHVLRQVVQISTTRS